MESHGFGDTSVMGVPFNIDALLHEMSTARSPPARSTPTCSSGPRPRMSKVTKPGSAGSSPQYIQRRRTSASHRLAKYISDLYPYPVYGQQLAPQPHISQATSSPPNARPISWHPSTIPLPDTDRVVRQHRLSLSFAGYQTVQMNGIPTPMTQPALTPDLPNDNWFSLESTGAVGQPTDGYACHVQANVRSMDQSSRGLPPQYASHLSVGATPGGDMQPFFFPAAGSNMWPEPTHTAPSSIYTAPPTPETLPTLQQSDPVVADPESSLPSKVEPNIDDGPELVGMGLYDPPVRPDYSVGHRKFNSVFGMVEHTEPTGKGLKLEETWEPPKEDEDASSETSEDAENEEDTDMFITPDDETSFDPFEESTINRSNTPPESSQRKYDDMSNHSLIFGKGDSGVAAEPMVLNKETAQLWLRATMVNGGIGS